MITNRPIHCYGSLINPKRAQRILWKYESENHPPIHFIHVCNNHFVALLPKTPVVIRGVSVVIYLFLLFHA